MTDSAPPAYCVYQDFEPRERGPIRFDRHYLMYAVRGAVGLAVDGRRWTLPPTYAAWIPADTEIDIELKHPITCCSVLFAPEFLVDAPSSSSVFTMTELAREMVAFTRRWGPSGASFGPHAESFFRALAHTCLELAADPVPMWRPLAVTAEIERALDYTEANLARDVSLAEVARAAALSTRSLHRRFSQEVGATWAESLRRLRMVRAVERLSNTTDSVLEVALDVGYASLSAFSKAFKAFTGHTPGQFRERQRGGDDKVPAE